MFDTLDANRGYWLIEMEEADRALTELISPRVLYRFTRMLSGLQNASSTSQRILDVISISIKWQQALVYMEDIPIF